MIYLGVNFTFLPEGVVRKLEDMIITEYIKSVQDIQECLKKQDIEIQPLFETPKLSLYSIFL